MTRRWLVHPKDIRYYQSTHVWPEDTIVSIAAIEAESAEVIAATGYPLMLAGATVWTVPVMEFPVAKTVEVEKKLRG